MSQTSAKATFNFEKIKTSLGNLQTSEREFMVSINKINELINYEINIGEKSAILGVKGKKLLDLWNNKCSIYKEFYNILEDITRRVINAYNNYVEMYNSSSDESSSKIDYLALNTKGSESNEFLTNVDSDTYRVLGALMNFQVKVDGTYIFEELASTTETSIEKELTIMGMNIIVSLKKDNDEWKIEQIKFKVNGQEQTYTSPPTQEEFLSTLNQKMSGVISGDVGGGDITMESVLGYKSLLLSPLDKDKNDSEQYRDNNSESIAIANDMNNIASDITDKGTQNLIYNRIYTIEPNNPENVDQLISELTEELGYSTTAATELKSLMEMDPSSIGLDKDRCKEYYTQYVLPVWKILKSQHNDRFSLLEDLRTLQQLYAKEGYQDNEETLGKISTLTATINSKAIGLMPLEFIMQGTGIECREKPQVNVINGEWKPGEIADITPNASFGAYGENIVDYSRNNYGTVTPYTLALGYEYALANPTTSKTFTTNETFLYIDGEFYYDCEVTFYSTRDMLEASGLNNQGYYSRLDSASRTLSVGGEELSVDSIRIKTADNKVLFISEGEYPDQPTLSGIKLPLGYRFVEEN